ncbi:MAG: tetratricopeptide repeat protein [Limisphaerales bacterium]
MRCAVLGVVFALVVGVYAWSANSGPIELLGSKAENTYYNLLVQGLCSGQLNLKTPVPPGLKQLADPYDPMASDPYRWNYGHPLHDLSYYKGKLYLYFGITPALMLFWPCRALTGHCLLHKDAVVIFFSAGFLAGAGLLLSLWRRYFADVSFWIVVSCVIALGLANFTPAILERCDVYEVAISCGYAMTMLALAGIWCACHDSRRQWPWLAAASLAYGLALGARPSLLFGAIILLTPVVQAWRQKRCVWPLLIAATIPIVLIGLGLMFYNALRFGNPLDFGQHYLLSSTRLDTANQFLPRYLWFNSRISFLQPARWSGHVPFVNDIVVPSLPAGAGEPEHPFGVLTNIPLIWLALAVPLAWRGRSAEVRSTLRCFLGAIALLSAICALTLLLYFTMCLRYEVEFTHSLVLLAVVGILALEHALAGHPAWRRVARCGWGLLLTFSVAFNLLAGFGLQAEARLNLGKAFEQMGRVDDAIAEYQKALRIRPDYADAQNNLGNALHLKGRLDEAISHYQEALVVKPDDAEAHNNLGNALLETGRADEAISQYQLALHFAPAFAEAHNNLATALDRKGRVDEAIVQYQDALRISPSYAEARYNLALALEQKGRSDQAILQYREALQIKPDYAEAHNALGAALLQKGSVDEAISEFQNALQTMPSLAAAHYNLALALVRMGRVDEAISQYQMTLRLEPADVESQNNLAWLLATCAQASLRNGDKAVELARQANALTGGENPVILHTLAAAYAEAGRFSEAVQTAQRALQLAGAQSKTRLAGQLQSELNLYETGRPFHDPE